jgi:hypothetical protein
MEREQLKVLWKIEKNPCRHWCNPRTLFRVAYAMQAASFITGTISRDIIREIKYREEYR